MRTIIAGSRSLVGPRLVAEAVAASGFEVTTVLSGTARGIDQSGEAWAIQNGLPVERYPADWERYEKGAGMVRNRTMAEKADALIAIWDGKSSGTANMIETARSAGLKVYVHSVHQMMKFTWGMLKT